MAAEDGTLGRYASPCLPLSVLADSVQICNFLRSMVSEVNLDAVNPNANGKEAATQLATDFAPMRRKLQILNA